MNTKKECTHYNGRIWINGKIGSHGNICAEIKNTPAGGELKVLAHVPIITGEAIKKAILSYGWRLEDWLDVSCYNCRFFKEDYQTGTADCLKFDELTEDEFEKHFGDDEEGCPQHRFVYDMIDERGLADAY